MTIRTAYADPESPALLAARGEQLLAALDKFIERRARDAEQVRAQQFDELRALVAYAYEEIPLYREKYDAARFHPAQLRTLDDLPQIPFLTKADLRQAAPRQLRSARARSPAWLFSSSGSTGTPSRFYRSEESLWNYVASGMALYYEWCGRRPIDNCLYLLDLMPGSIDLAVADLLRTVAPAERVLSIAQPTRRLIEAIDDFAPEYVSSYPSTLRNVAIELRRQGRTYDRLRLMHATSELLDGRTRNILHEAFPSTRIVETYSSTEGGLMARQCADGQMHVLEENVIVEIVDAAGAATDGRGEIVVTDLTNRATPIIRYRGLGDYCRWNLRPCCGGKGRVLSALEGRVAESILRSDGAWISPYVFINALDKIAGLRQIQLVQHHVGQFEIRAVRDSSGRTDDDLADALRGSLLAMLDEPGDVSCRVNFVNEIAAAGTGHKSPLVVSRLGRRP